MGSAYCDICSLKLATSHLLDKETASSHFLSSIPQSFTFSTQIAIFSVLEPHAFESCFYPAHSSTGQPTLPLSRTQRQLSKPGAFLPKPKITVLGNYPQKTPHSRPYRYRVIACLLGTKRSTPSSSKAPGSKTNGTFANASRRHTCTVLRHGPPSSVLSSR